jgi:hypothetical protein
MRGLVKAKSRCSLDTTPFAEVSEQHFSGSETVRDVVIGMVDVIATFIA